MQSAAAAASAADGLTLPVAPNARYARSSVCCRQLFHGNARRKQLARGDATLRWQCWSKHTTIEVFSPRRTGEIAWTWTLPQLPAIPWGLESPEYEREDHHCRKGCSTCLFLYCCCQLSSRRDAIFLSAVGGRRCGLVLRSQAVQPLEGLNLNFKSSE